VVRPGTPRTAREILNRVNEITFNSSLLKDLWTIDLIHRLMMEGRLDGERFRDIRLHLIESDEEMVPLGASSKLNAEWEFLTLLRDIGRRAAGRWLDRHFDDIGERATIDLRAMVRGHCPKNWA
jgi:NTE family protein